MYDYITEELGPSSFIRGLNYNARFIKLLKTELDGDKKDLYFRVKSQRGDFYYNVNISTDINSREFDSYECECPQFYNYYSCKHVAACALKYESELFSDENYNDMSYMLDISSQIIDTFYRPKSSNIRKRLNLEISLDSGYEYYHGYYLSVRYRIGEERLYTLKGKYTSFKSSYISETPYKMSKNFTYDPAFHYFDSKDKRILDFTDDGGGTSDNSGDIIFSNNIDSFMKLLKDREYFINDRQYFGVSDENPFIINLTKDGDIFNLTIENIKDFSTLVKGARYIYDDSRLYVLSKKLMDLFYYLRENELDGLAFKKEYINKVTNGIIPIVKNNINISDDVDEIVITKSPDARLYFDFRYNDIECKVKLNYGDKEINIFDKVDGIVRDEGYESNIFGRLQELNFDVKDGKIILDDIDDIGYFLEEGIFSLNEYEVFTSERIKGTDIVKRSNNSVSFSIGQDNILSFGFNLDGIEDDELSDVLSSLKSKKKYHKLKNGNIIDLSEDENIKKIGSLTDEMGLSNREIDEGHGVIPKYRAIYLDSLRSGYGGIISTNNQFDDLIKNFYEYKDKNIDLSKNELKILRDYQSYGVKWLYNIYKTGFGGILADEMGLGKSIQLIYLIKLILKEKPNSKILIVSPTSLIYNWEKEFDKFSPDLSYKVFSANKEQRLAELKSDKDTNVLITSYGLVRNDFETYEKMKFELVAIDEAQNIKNPHAGVTKTVKKLNSNVKIALTGTPLENSVMELWSIFDFIMPGYLANNKKFQSLYNVKNMEEDSVRRLDSLNKQIKYFILRRKKKDVVKDLPDKIDNNIFIELNDKQKKIYAFEVQKTKESMEEMIKTEGFEGARFKILQLLTKLRQICIDPSLVFDNYKGESSKIQQLLEIINMEKSNGHKILLFSSYKKALDMVGQHLSNNKVSYYYISGEVSAKKRMELVDNFNNDDTDVFMITIKSGGTGLNLTSATVVIHLDLWWNPQVENQATDRAHRIGQKNTVEVIRIISKGTIEERILELQNKKRKLAEVLIEGDSRGENEFSRLTEKDIKLLLSMDNREK